MPTWLVIVFFMIVKVWTIVYAWGHYKKLRAKEKAYL